MKSNIHKSLSILVLVLVLFLVSTSCANSHPDKPEALESSTTVQTLSGGSTTDSSTQKSQFIETYLGSEEVIREVCERVNSIDFTIREYPINTELYDSETDLIYKEAFLNAITNKAPIKQDGKDVIYKDLLRGVAAMDDKEFLELMLRKTAEYFYMDFDGDGLPELTIECDGSIVLKYEPDDNYVSIIASSDSDTKLLGSGQRYTYNPNSSESVYYAYWSKDKNGKKDFVHFIKSGENFEGEWKYHYFVSMDEFQDVELSEEQWNEITKDLFYARDNALPSLSFEEVFGNIL